MDKSKLAVKTYNKIADIYTQKYFDYLEDNPVIDQFLANLPANAKILDVGCGPGNIAGFIEKKGFQVEGIDLSQEMIKIAKQKVPGVSFKVMDMRNLQYPEQSFEGIISTYSLIHIPSDEIPQVLKMFNRVLKKGGVILIIAQEGEEDKIEIEPLMSTEQTFVNFFTKERLAKFLTEADFSVLYQKVLPLADEESMSNQVIYTIAQKI